jgi:DNA-binding GntR family transcriptional regulator
MASSSLPFGQLQRVTSGAQAALYIRKLIFDGHLEPGARVHQDDVARALGISRIPVREALISLEREGWVTIEPNRGAFVTPLDEQAVHDHYALYGLVFGYAAQKALERSDELLGEKLQQVATDFARSTDARETQHLAITFNSTVTEAANSPRINVVHRALSALVPGDFYELVPDARATQAPGFAAIASACQAGDGSCAAEEYSKMMDSVGCAVAKLFADRGLFTSQRL